MQYYYGDKNPLRMLDEIDFWKQQESEHTVVIRQIVKNLESSFVKQLQEWELLFSQTQGNAVRYIEAVNRSKGIINAILLENIRQLTIYAYNQSMNFVNFLNQLIAESEAVKNNDIAIVAINHIRRESEYFIGIVTAAMRNH